MVAGLRPEMASFLKGHFRRGTNYDCEEIGKLLHRFDSEWGLRFGAFIAKNDEIKQSISGCYAVRNSVAHGGAGNLGSRVLRQYYAASLDLIAELEATIR